MRRRDPIPKRKINVMGKVKGYIDRAERLKAVLREHDSTSTSASSLRSKESDERSKRVENLFHETSDDTKDAISFKDIAGMQYEKQVLQEAVILPRY